MAAAQAAGPCPTGEETQWFDRVRELARDLYVLGDTVGQEVQRLERSQKFTATLLAVQVEQRSTRGVLTLRNTSGELEQPIRTDRGDGEAGRAMLDRARGLVGHRVRVYRQNEQMTSNAKYQVRVAVHLADLGEDTDPIPEASAKQHLVQAADGDTDAAQEAWNAAGLPESGSVTARQLVQALAFLSTSITLESPS